MAFECARSRALLMSGRAARPRAARAPRARDSRDRRGRRRASSTRSRPPAATSSAHRPTLRKRRLGEASSPALLRMTAVATMNAAMTPDEYCQQKAAQSGSSFYYSFLFLPPERRRAITALYAFCREVDDVVDEVQRRRRGAHQARVVAHRGRRLFAGHPQHPVTRALRRSCAPTACRRRMNEIIDGMEMDLVHHRYADFEALGSIAIAPRASWACFRVDLRLLRTRPRWNTPKTLGIAFQLTNIIRDVGEDARRGRVYLPADELARFGLSRRGLLRCAAATAFASLMRFQAERAQRVLRPRVRAARARGPRQPARGPHHGRDLSHAARRDRARRLPGAAAAHGAHAAAQALDRVERTSVEGR